VKPWSRVDRKGGNPDGGLNGVNSFYEENSGVLLPLNRELLNWGQITARNFDILRNLGGGGGELV